jgi:hypothetical protein
MIPELALLRHALTLLRNRLPRSRDDAGYSTEAVIVIALLAAMAIAAVGIIAAKVLAKANSISTG